MENIERRSFARLLVCRLLVCAKIKSKIDFNCDAIAILKCCKLCVANQLIELYENSLELICCICAPTKMTETQSVSASIVEPKISFPF